MILLAKTVSEERTDVMRTRGKKQKIGWWKTLRLRWKSLFFVCWCMEQFMLWGGKEKASLENGSWVIDFSLAVSSTDSFHLESAVENPMKHLLPTAYLWRERVAKKYSEAIRSENSFSKSQSRITQSCAETSLGQCEFFFLIGLWPDP